MRIVIATDGNVSLVEWIIDDTLVLLFLSIQGTDLKAIKWFIAFIIRMSSDFFLIILSVIFRKYHFYRNFNELIVQTSNHVSYVSNVSRLAGQKFFSLRAQIDKNFGLASLDTLLTYDTWLEVRTMSSV